MFKWIRFVVVVAKKVEYTQAEHFESYARMAVIIKPVQNFDTETKN
jgi:hypothetical protein